MLLTEFSLPTKKEKSETMGDFNSILILNETDFFFNLTMETEQTSQQ